MPSYIVTAHRKSSTSLKVKAANKYEARRIVEALLDTDRKEEVFFNDHIISINGPEEDDDA